MAVALNADLYAIPRLNIFFTGVVPSLDGQCVSLVKWFMQDMSEVPNPQMARGDARYVGQTLVRQGHATEVAYADRKRGDIICYEYGTYGHIAVQLSGGRVFEQNVNLGGVQSKIVDGERVYASRIGSETEAWRTGKNPHVYRLKTYKEGESDMIQKEDIYSIRVIMSEVEGWNGHLVHSGKYDENILSWVGKTWEEMIQHCWKIQPTHRIHLTDKLTLTEAAVKDLKTSTAQLSKTVEEKNAQIIAQQKEIESLKAQVGDNSKWETLKALIRELVGISN